MTKQAIIINGRLYGKRQKRLVVAGLLALLALASTGWAAGQAAPYLREGVGARALGMGNAQTCDCWDASAAYWNPALLSQMPDTTSLIAQTAVLGWERSWNFLSAAGVDPVGQPERFAYAASWISFSGGGDIEARTENRPDPDHIFRDSEQALMLSVADSTSSDFSLGLTLKYLTQELDTGSANGLGFDLGSWYRISADTRCGLVLQDVYSTLNWSDSYQDRVPLYLRLGVAQDLLAHRLLVAGDLGLEYTQAAGQVTDTRYHLGLEYSLAKTLVVRAGVDSGRWTLGAGWKFPIQQLAWVHLDYALAGGRAPDEGMTNFLSLVIGVPSKFDAY